MTYFFVAALTLFLGATSHIYMQPKAGGIAVAGVAFLILAPFIASAAGLPLGSLFGCYLASRTVKPQTTMPPNYRIERPREP